jgi:predicted transcriptional regulator
MPQRMIAHRLKKTTYWVRKVLNKNKKNRWAILKGSKRPVKFNKIHKRARAIIEKYIKECHGPILATDIQ